MPQITMPTFLIAILVALFICLTLYVLAGRDVAIVFTRCVAGALVRRVRTIRRRKSIGAATVEQLAGHPPIGTSPEAPG